LHAEHESHTLTLSGNPELEEGSPATGDEKHSTVVVSAVVDVKHIPGRYTVARAVFYSFARASFGVGAPGMPVPPYTAVFAPATHHVPFLAHDWPEIEIRPDIPYVEITGVELDEGD
jgi:hypothetical protein